MRQKTDGAEAADTTRRLALISLTKRSAPAQKNPPYTDPDLAESQDARRAFEEEILLGRVRKEISRRLDELHIRRRDLAQRLGVSEGRISQMLSGGENLTLKSLAGLALALDARFDLSLGDLAQAEHEYEKKAEMDRVFLSGGG
jgi:transcriptional regulator with XRE-family HTH domain